MSDKHRAHPLRQLWEAFVDGVHNLGLGVEVIHILVLATAPLPHLAQTRKDEALERLEHFRARSCFGDVDSLCDFEIVRVLIERLARGLRLGSVVRVAEVLPEVGDGEDGVGPRKGRDEGGYVIQIALDYFDALGDEFLCRGACWVARDTAYTPVWKSVKCLSDGTTLELVGIRSWRMNSDSHDCPTYLCSSNTDDDDELRHDDSSGQI